MELQVSQVVKSVALAKDEKTFDILGTLDDRDILAYRIVNACPSLLELFNGKISLEGDLRWNHFDQRKEAKNANAECLIHSVSPLETTAPTEPFSDQSRFFLAFV